MWPKSNVEFWKNKIETTVKRDKEKKKQLNALGWHVITVWECELKKDKIENTLNTLVQEVVCAKEITE